MYLGAKKILSHREVDGYIFVDFEDGTSDKFSVAQFQDLATEESVDPTTFRQRRCFFLQKEVYKTLLSHNTLVSDMEFLCMVLKETVQMNYKTAVNSLWGKDEEKNLWEMHAHIKPESDLDAKGGIPTQS